MKMSNESKTGESTASHAALVGGAQRGRQGGVAVTLSADRPAPTPDAAYIVRPKRKKAALTGRLFAVIDCSSALPRPYRAKCADHARRGMRTTGLDGAMPSEGVIASDVLPIHTYGAPPFSGRSTAPTAR